MSEPRFEDLTPMAAIWMIAVAMLSSPLDQYIAQSSIILQPASHAVIGLLGVGLGLAAVAGLVRAGASVGLATYSTMVVILSFWAGGGLTTAFGGLLAVAIGTAVAGAAILIVRRLIHMSSLHVAFFALAVFLTLNPWVSELARDSQGSTPGELMANQVSYTGGGMDSDIYVVVLDAYPGIQILADRAAWTDGTATELRQHGFSVAPAWTAYSMTAISVPALLDASYPVTAIDGVQSSVGIGRRLISEGEAAFFDYVTDAGYATTMIEPPLGEYRCPSIVETCVEPPLLDDLLFHTLKQSYLRLLLDPVLGSSWIHGARRGVEWIEDHAAELDDNGRRDFVFAHLIVPHPPFLLDETCEIDYRQEYDAIAVDHMPERNGVVGAQMSQIACVDRMLLRIVDAVAGDAVVLFTADHGSAFEGQFVMPPDSWPTSAIAERMSAFFAMRAPEQCQPRSPIIVQNLLRGIMRCMGAPDLPDLPLRMFLSNVSFDEGGRPLMAEVDRETLELLVIDAGE